MLNTLERELFELVTHLKSMGHYDIPQALKKLDVEQVEPQHRRALEFFKSLSGNSREFMIDTICGRRKNKLYLHKR